jgi:copper chaperone NosL
MKRIVWGVLLGMAVMMGTMAAQAQMFQSVTAEEAQLLQSGEGKLYCPGCGMNLVKFYKTSHAMTHGKDHTHQYCSLHCLVEANSNLDGALVVDAGTLKFMPAAKAFYAVGSSKKGTMTMTSKYAFGSQAAAEKFVSEFGGEVMDFAAAAKMATTALPGENKMIDKKRAKAAAKGRKIFESMCGDAQLPQFSSIAEAKTYLAAGGACGALNDGQYQALAIYLMSERGSSAAFEVIDVPEKAKCPVCGMFVAKYPKWTAVIEGNDGKFYYFDGVKDMMKFIFRPAKYHSDTTLADYKKIVVSDYYTLHAINAVSAWYVIGSNVYGPMGDELIPFGSKDDATTFMKDHFGDRVVSYDTITEDMVLGLDK